MGEFLFYLTSLESSIGPETIFHVYDWPVSNAMLSAIIATVIILLIAVVVRLKLNVVPGKLQTVVEMGVNYIYDICVSVSDKERAKKFFPWIMTFFLFILINNLLGITPLVGPFVKEEGEHAIELFKGATTDLNLTFGLGIISFFLVQFYGFKIGGITGWFKHYFHTKPIYIIPIFIFVGILELILEPIKSASLAFRLFGNVFAGESLIASLTSVNGISIPFVTVPFLLLEVLVGVIQALVFSLLTLVFMSIITNKH